MFIEILEYLGLAVVIVAFYSSYQRFKNAEFTKEYQEQQEEEEPKTKFQRWWKKSYLREVYVVRAGQRKLISFIPWIGFWISGLFLLFSSWWIINEMLHPTQVFKKFKKYDGIVIGYIRYNKSDDILILKLNDGSVKEFHGGVVTKVKAVKDKNVTLYTQVDWGISDFGTFESIQWLELKGKEYATTYKLDKTYEDRLKRINGYTNNAQNFLIPSLKWLIFFLILLWFINRNPLKQKNQTTDKKD